ncbi:hypothetical protein [Aromatoleum evansii]|uniref:hypothetical protein n=1 Tax=Aromatoleum evansii TaxID=59406 RepID=UPI00145F26D8|nr:hypothetical protein [Aromatoleum evansii]NMG29256.1 hypothetical protein [Aromatoleum evansii]
MNYRPPMRTEPPDWPLYSLFFLLLGGSYLPISLVSGMNAYFLVLALVVWGTRNNRFPKSLWVLLICFSGIIALGMAFGYDNEPYPYLKDAWYFINPVGVILVGYSFGALTPRLSHALRLLVIAGLILASLHLAKFAINPNLLSLPATEVRALAGNGNFVVGLTCAFLIASIGRWREMLAIRPIFGWIVLLLCGVSITLAYSRTLVLVVLVFWTALRGLMLGSRFVKLGAAVIVGLALLGALAASLPPASEAEKKTFTGKMLRSAQELTIADYRDQQSINDNFRGFETARAYKDYVDGGVLRWLGGRGFGHFVDLGVYLFLGDGPMRYIPVLHNGMLYVLVKTGALGLILYLVSFGWLFRRGAVAARSVDPDERFAGLIVQGAVAVSLLTSWLIAGPFNKTALVSVLLLLGFCLSIVERKEWKR